MAVSVLQQLADVATTTSAFHVIEALGFSGIGLAGWRFTLKITQLIESLRGNIRALEVSVKNHIDITPTLIECVQHKKDVEKFVVETQRTLREEMAVLMLEHGSDLRVLSEKVQDTQVTCGKRHGFNGKDK